MASIPTFPYSSFSYSLLKLNTLSNSHHSCILPPTSLFGTRLTIQKPLSSTRSLAITNFRATSANVSFIPPTPEPQSAAPVKTSKEPQSAAPVKTSKWSARAIKSCALAEVEMRKLKYANIGTETLLMGILNEGTSRAAKFLRANGITYLKVREQSIELLGKSSYFFVGSLELTMTEPAQKALDWALNEKAKSGEEGETNVSHLLLGIWAQEESAGRKILSALGFNDEKAKEIAKTATSGDIDWRLK